ncbi:amidohydrolase family protein [Paenibacillus sp. LMG 31460]|uniref:Amidohydrolase family protein n=1 Tax=Paenibacillus germinis TaxID=2654979 RepID=A0ABX1Z8N4_9BACL|nr:amidohydrolase family protein [Paenibacillus germinis]NOU88238.1 amidohydrolase family protein [Paenibacillus germinis]
MIIDAHQHYWKLARGDYAWLSPQAGAVLYRDYMPEQLKPDLKQNNVVGTVLVQAAATMEETEFMLEICKQEETVLGVVGWLDLEGADFEKHYLRFRADSHFVGIRPNLPIVEDGDWSRYPKLLCNLALLAEDGFPIDFLIGPSDLPRIVKLLDLVPKVSAVVDHLAFPDISGKGIDSWTDGLNLIAQFEYTACKLSGLATGAGGMPWQAVDVAPYVERICKMFGSDRIIFGSDWPVCLQAGSFTEILEIAREALPSSLTPSQRNAIFAGNAARIYRLDMKEMKE